jgi:Protein of unknown function (DUF3179)
VADVNRAPGLLAALLATSMSLTGCGSSAPTGPTGPTEAPTSAGIVDPVATFPPPPAFQTGALPPEVMSDLDRLVASFEAGRLDGAALESVGASGDARLAWLVSDLLRFLQGGGSHHRLLGAFEAMTGVDPAADPAFDNRAWTRLTDMLIAWDTPAPPGYREHKARIFLAIEPKWAPFFEDVDAAIDWRLVSWGGVLIDDRHLGATAPCSRGCIPALDHPRLTTAADGDWYPDDRIVFGIEIDGDAVALPRNIMEVHEMVNMNLGGRRLGVPYCTLCGSAQVYFTDSVPSGVEVPVLRTSGLLNRSNKVMYDLVTGSVIDTFTGEALSGPLQDAGVVLEQATVVVTTWAEWRTAHPLTRIVAEDGGLRVEYPLEPLGGRDDNGPIFPIGDADPRLPVQASVLGVIAPDGTALAFPADQARAALRDGRAVHLAGVEVISDAGGLRAQALGGGELPAHQAFWFAWSQFHPGTLVWTPLGP